jgi:hypothetical protein
MLGLIRYITSPFSTPHSLTVLYTTLCTTHIGICMLPGTTLHRRIRQNPKELKHSTLYHSTFLRVLVAVSTEVW